MRIDGSNLEALYPRELREGGLKSNRDDASPPSRISPISLSWEAGGGLLITNPSLGDPATSSLILQSEFPTILRSMPQSNF